MYFPFQFSSKSKLNYWKGPKPYTATSGWNYDKSLQSVKHEQPAVLILCHITNANAAELQHYSLFTQHVDRRSDWQPLWFPNAGPRGTLRQRSPIKAVYRAAMGYNAIFREEVDQGQIQCPLWEKEGWAGGFPCSRELEQKEVVMLQQVLLDASIMEITVWYLNVW